MAFVHINQIVSDSFRRERERSRLERFGARVVEPIIRPPQPITEWPNGKLIAILRILRNDCARDCLEAWAGHEKLCGQHDFVSLREEGLAFRRGKATVHDLTANGRAWAESAARLVAQRLGLHHIRNSATSVRFRTVTCTCGWRRQFDSRFGRADIQARKSASNHLAEVNNAMR